MFRKPFNVVIVVFALLSCTTASFAETNERHCEQVARSVAAKYKAENPTASTPEALRGVMDGAYRGCLAARAPRDESSDGERDNPAIAQTDKKESSGFMDLFTGESKRTKGHRRLHQRGRH